MIRLLLKGFFIYCKLKLSWSISEPQQSGVSVGTWWIIWLQVIQNNIYLSTPMNDVSRVVFAGILSQDVAKW